jgi:hypothetical protein
MDLETLGERQTPKALSAEPLLFPHKFGVLAAKDGESAGADEQESPRAQNSEELTNGQSLLALGKMRQHIHREYEVEARRAEGERRQVSTDAFQPRALATDPRRGRIEIGAENRNAIPLAHQRGKVACSTAAFEYPLYLVLARNRVQQPESKAPHAPEPPQSFLVSHDVRNFIGVDHDGGLQNPAMVAQARGRKQVSIGRGPPRSL